MRKIFFSLREFCEVKTMETIINHFLVSGYKIHWCLLNFSVNTDFLFHGIEKAFADYDNVSIFQFSNSEELSGIKIYGFKTDMTHEFDSYVHTFISCAEIVTCRSYTRCDTRFRDSAPVIVLGNVKVKSPVEDFQVEIFNRLSQLPYKVIVVPRHPLTSEEMTRVEIPQRIEFRNTMGELENLHASANLTIMGRIFSDDGLKPDDDHNPIEATINSNTLCGLIKEVPESYRWLYEESGLIHQCQSYDELFSRIDKLIIDPELPEKLKKRDEWIVGNHIKYLKKVEDVLDL